MKTKKQSSYIYIYILIAILNLSLISSISFINSPSTSAVSYSSNLGISFTFLPTLKIILSSTGCGSGTGGLCIDNLSPGTANDSNILTITVLNNTGNGYTLTANVGDNTTNSGRFNTSDLVHTDTNITNKFVSLATNANIANNTDFTDSTWGYSYMDETLSNPSWSNYSGLPLYSATTPATLKTSYSPATSAEGDNIKFKIAAKSASNQASGEYNNVINFMITSQPIPVTLSMAYENAGKQKHNGYYKLQDMNANICNAAEVLDEGSQMQAIDIRDNKVYWITKLQDGKCWMTQNLDLDLSNSTALTSDTTDLTSYGSGGYTTANGYSQQTINGNNVISWTPTRATINATNVTNNRISNWSDDNNTPYSVDPGNWYWNALPFYASTDNLFLNNQAGDKFQKNTPYANNGEHGHVGNYYNWSTAVATNSTSSYTASTINNPANNPQNSICPAGWRLPSITSASPTYTTAGSQDEFSRLANLYANYTGNTSLSSQNLEAAPLYLVRAGRVYSSQQYYAGSYCNYWSSSVDGSSNAYLLGFNSSNVDPQINGHRFYGFSVRCVAR